VSGFFVLCDGAATGFRLFVFAHNAEYNLPFREKAVDQCGVIACRAGGG
jgi:hypothetical protein